MAGWVGRALQALRGRGASEADVKQGSELAFKLSQQGVKRLQRRVDALRSARSPLCVPARPIAESEIASRENQELFDGLVRLLDAPGSLLGSIAAPQVARSVQAFAWNSRLLEVDGKKVERPQSFVVINPEVLENGPDVLVRYESSTSIPDVTAKLPRFRWLRVRYLTREGRPVEERVDDAVACVFQHNMGVLRGQLLSEVVREVGDESVAFLLRGRGMPPPVGPGIPRVITLFSEIERLNLRV